MHGSNIKQLSKNSAPRSKITTRMEETIKNQHKKQLHYTALCQNIQNIKGISSCCERSRSQQVQHTLTGHLATANTEHRKNMARLLRDKINK